ncbi:hypothetical protein MRQ36_15155 [Micromonospora sp. R77]|uniref:hypothetical protein n=1 Tax=Micromonospora sp. R77 TaxID=2925836 RepID=UPI001F6179C4|nr:hypothetical protein [Micromonospora sp. R77]MCI4063849.1 hypothetical protein [Micromonospora sp. R77]
MSAPTRVESHPDAGRVDDRSGPVGPGWLVAAGWVTLVVVLAALLVRYWNGPPYSPDSWGYYELSRHLGADFFHIDGWRSYQSTAPYGMSFGPLWPVLIGLTAAVTRTGPHAALVAATGCVLATAGVLSVLGRRFGVRALGPVVAVGLLGFPPYVDEVLSGRTFPLAGLLLSLLLLALVTAARRPGWAGPAAGAAAAGIVLTRPDTLLAVALLAVLVIVARRRHWRGLLAAGLVFAVLMVPWAIYGLAHFGTPFVADNRLVASAVPPLHILDFFPDVSQVPTVADDPVGWLARVGRNLPPVATQAVLAGLDAPTVVATALAGLLLLRRGLALRGERRWLLPGLGTLAAFTVQVLSAELTTGYPYPRYLSLVVLIVLVMAIGLISRAPAPARLAGRRTGTAVAVALLALPAGWALGHQFSTVPPRPDYLTGGAVEQELRRCHADTTLTMSDGRLAGLHAALTGRRTAVFPRNFADLPVAARREWLVRYGVGQLYVPPLPPDTDPLVVKMTTDALPLIAGAARVTPDPCATLGRSYRVSVD